MSSVAVECARKPIQEPGSKRKDMLLKEEEEQLVLETSELSFLQMELGKERKNNKEV